MAWFIMASQKYIYGIYDGRANSEISILVDVAKKKKRKVF